MENWKVKKTNMKLKNGSVCVYVRDLGQIEEFDCLEDSVLIFFIFIFHYYLNAKKI